MRLLLAFALVCIGAGAANAVNFSAGQAPLVKGPGQQGSPGVITELGGEDFASAYVIGSLPFVDSGNTCDNFDNVAEATCGFAYGAPDVVYAYYGNGMIVSLAGSDYDTMIGVYDAAGNELCCNDDYFGLQSYVECCAYGGPQWYYIVVDGYYSNCGNFALSVSSCGAVCDVVCPAGGVPEGEPPCGTDYYDAYNGGCNSVGWTEICPTDGNHATVCGKSGTYTYFGGSYRDTDWYVVYGAGSVSVTMEAEFMSQLILIGPPADCNLSVYSYDQGVPCEVIGPLYTFAGTPECPQPLIPVWVWAGASVFNGVPCESDYVLQIDGICCGPIATQSTTWGTVKGLYR